MNIELANELYVLKRLIDNDPRVLKLNSADNSLSNNDEACSLAYKKQESEIKYSDALKYFPENSKEVNGAQKELFIAKKHIDELPITREYYAAYKDVRELYNYINETLFAELNKRMHNCD